MLDLSGPWRLTFDTVVPWATQVADPFHLVRPSATLRIVPHTRGSLMWRLVDSDVRRSHVGSEALGGVGGSGCFGDAGAATTSVLTTSTVCRRL
jgi:hypothetical protein